MLNTSVFSKEFIFVPLPQKIQKKNLYMGNTKEGTDTLKKNQEFSLEITTSRQNIRISAIVTFISAGVIWYFINEKKCG